MKLGIIGILLLAIGLFMFCAPQTYWEVTERWKSSADSEPSELYIKHTRLGGIIFAAVGVFNVIAEIFL